MAKHRRKDLSHWKGEYYYRQNQWRHFTKPALKRKIARIMSYLVSFLGK